MNPQTYSALLSVATAIANNQVDQSRQPLSTSLEAVDDWQDVADQAEVNGLSVMLSQLNQEEDLGLPRALKLQLLALCLRHQKVLTARETVLSEVIETFTEHKIDFVLLKGAALSPLIYDPPWLRPMRDIDILVRKEDAPIAQALLRSIDFENDDFKPGYLYEHHHLPNSVRQQDGFAISLEVHHDALSGDVNESINFDNLLGKPRAFNLADKQAYALSHTDTLKHLCHHTFEPAEIIKLGSMVDLIRYADHFVTEINWRELEESQPRIHNTLRCIHPLIPLPYTLISKLGLMPENWQPSGIGNGFKPLSHIMKLDSTREKLTELLIPSGWWMHIFYAIPPEKSLLYTRLVRHPFRILKWLFRRYRAAHRSKQLQP